ncbi:carboxylate-amine ligase Arth_3862 [Arthrobacter sp. Hiyo8]|nr:carboxylate-amine ligase Arth_3862 [Arthrobacter sp. Hiyo8]
MRTFGVEEELLIVDPVTGEPLALADALLSAPPTTAPPTMTLPRPPRMAPNPDPPSRRSTVPIPA